ncbi:sulfate ABC transporter substrate-binding protein [Synechococcus sp. CCY 9618]|uniref:sulfate ABC transporter substrate-binding protein n=1 Tax=Synechococcus sp. CCY 9618 TaxID=2815602 RepID=UPI00352D9844
MVRHCIGALPSLALGGVLLGGLALGGCSSQPPDNADGGGSQELLLVSYAVTKGAYDRILPKFEADWKARTGRTLTVRTSYGGSGSQTRAIIDGLDADVATLALAGDVLKLQKAGLVAPGWEKELPQDSMITNSVVAFVPRQGNPKGIRTWADLARPGLAVVSANPKTSGGARWNFLGLWGSVSQTGGEETQAKAYVASVYRNVDNLPKDAREASDVFLKRGQGDVLLNYENEAILARRTGDLTTPFLVPEVNIRIEGPVTVVDRNVDRKGTRKAAEALAAYLQGEPAQEIFAEEGFRPVSPAVWSRVKGRFAPVKQLFSVSDFGGWSRVNETFFGKSGVWDQLFRASR